MKGLGWVIVGTIALSIILGYMLFIGWEYGTTASTQQLSQMLDHNITVDVVITWVNSHDLTWQTQREERWQQLNKTTSSMDLKRFPSAKYAPDMQVNVAIASIRRFAPWVRDIIVVTARPQRPSTTVPIRIVHHDEFMVDLPTFNSHAIEANIHRIPGLSEQFLYSNDDIYLTAPVFAADYFSKQGLPILHTVPIMSVPISSKNNGYYAAWYNIIRLCTKNKLVTHQPQHTIVPLTKTLCLNVWKTWPTVLQVTAASAFRNINQNNQVPPVGMFILNGLQTHQVLLRRNSLSFQYIGLKGTLKNLTTSVCINNDHKIVELDYIKNSLLLPPPVRDLPGATCLIVAHPDDETLFGYTDLFRAERVHVVCLTHAKTSQRRQEFKRVLAIVGCTGEMMAYEDGKKIVWTKPLPVSLLKGGFVRIVSHDAQGEYGHLNHKATHRLASELAKASGTPYFTFLERKLSMNIHVEAQRNRCLEVYKTQKYSPAYNKYKNEF